MCRIDGRNGQTFALFSLVPIVRGEGHQESVCRCRQESEQNCSLELDDLAHFVSAVRAFEGALVMIRLAECGADGGEHHARAATRTVRPLDRVRIHRPWCVRRHRPHAHATRPRLSWVRADQMYSGERNYGPPWGYGGTLARDRLASAAAASASCRCAFDAGSTGDRFRSAMNQRHKAIMIASMLTLRS